MGTNFLLLPRIVHTSKLKIGVFRTDWIPDLPTPPYRLSKRSRRAYRRNDQSDVNGPGVKVFELSKWSKGKI